MSWLRIDDGFTARRKIAKLTDRQFRIWMRLLCYCAAHRDALVDDAAMSELKGLTPRLVEQFRELGLIDEEAGGRLVVHDWHRYQPREASTAFRQEKDSPRAGACAGPSPVQSSPNPATVTETGREATPSGNGSGSGLDRMDASAELERLRGAA